MKLGVFTLYDTKLEAYLTPFFSRATGDAKRSFVALLSNPQAQPARYPNDYHLAHLGFYDDETGLLAPFSAPVVVMTGVEAVVAAQKAASEAQAQSRPALEPEPPAEGEDA